MNGNQNIKLNHFKNKLSNITNHAIVPYSLWVHYEEGVCCLFQAIQEILANHLDKNVRSYLYYAKYLLDYHMLHIQITTNNSKINVLNFISLILQIFLQKINQPNIKYLLRQLVPQYKQAYANNNYPEFEMTQNPFKILDIYKNHLNTQRYELIAQMLSLALTKKDFLGIQPYTLVMGCISSITQYKGQKHLPQIQIMLEQKIIKQTKKLFKNLLNSIWQIQDIL